MELGRGTLKKLIFLLILTGQVFFLSAQEAESPASGQESAFPQINEAELPLFDQEAETPAENEVPSSVGLLDLIRVIFVLAAVIGMIYLLVYFLKKISPIAEDAEDEIQVLSTRHLKRDSSLHLIEVGNQVFLIGSGNSQVSLISEITDQETIDQIKLNQEQNSTIRRNSFNELIRKGLSLKTGDKLKEQSPDFLRSQRNRLRSLEDDE